jgi:predicted secreted protein/Tol biopolymer transport system component
MKKTISLILVLALVLSAEVANADFTFGEPTNLGPVVNSRFEDAGQSISVDGLALYFSSNRPGGSGDYDLWVTHRAATIDDWSEPENVGPVINTSYMETSPCLSADGLSLFFCDGVWHLYNPRPGGMGKCDLWVTRRITHRDPWQTPENLGPSINTSAHECDPSVSVDGLMLFFDSDRAGGRGSVDLWFATRTNISEAWNEPTNLGSNVNSSAVDAFPSLSADGLTLFFMSDRTGDYDLWITRRATVSEPWGPAVNLGLAVNSSSVEACPNISADGSTLFFMSMRPGGIGGMRDLWQVSIEPVVDFNGDGIVDCADMCAMVDHWGTDEQLYDIGPMPWGDGIVDVQDLIVLAEHFEKATPDEEVNVDEDDDGGQVKLEQGQVLVVTLESNPTTGYGWEVAEIQESILEQMGEAEFKPSETGEPPLVGAGGWEIFRFKAVSEGQMTLKLGYQRPWEEGVEPIDTFSIEVVVN